MLEAAYWIISYCVTLCNPTFAKGVERHVLKPAYHHVLKPVGRVFAPKHAYSSTDRKFNDGGWALEPNPMNPGVGAWAYCRMEGSEKRCIPQ